MAKRSKEKTTNEMEFQGQVLSWLNEELSRRPGLGLECATQETSKVDRKRNDLVVWRRRESHDAFLTLELKTPTTAITDPDFLADACLKAQRWKAPLFAIWNMQAAELYKTPPENNRATPSDKIMQYPIIKGVRRVEDWLDSTIRSLLRVRTVELLQTAWDEASTPATVAFRIDASVFVDRLTKQIDELRAEVTPELSRKASNRAIRMQLRQMAAQQGFLSFIDDIDKAIGGQFCYRLIGQILFYFSLKRKNPKLPPLDISATDEIPACLRPFWDHVRTYDYEALFAPNELDHIVPMNSHAQNIVRQLIRDFNRYDWNSLRDDVLGSIFERLIPRHEQMLLGQFYTPTPVADLLLVMAIDGEKPTVLDPGCGTGTFLLRSYQYLRDTRQLGHNELLPVLWGFDVSPFASELSVINLFRQDLSEFDNFPRIVSGDFFQRKVGDLVEFPPSRQGAQARIKLPIPQFDAVVANPPYLKSQHQDDLDPKYKNRLFSLVVTEHGLEAPPKTDLFAFFIYHAYTFLKPGGRLGFVTSSSWLTAEYGSFLQKFLLDFFKLIAVIGSDVESFFSQVDQNTVLFVAEKRGKSVAATTTETIRFVSFKKTLEELMPADDERWSFIQKLVDKIEDIQEGLEDESMRARVVQSLPELEALRERPDVPRNWSLYLRAPKLYFDIIDAGGELIVSLGNISECHLGYKSLQNQFFYIDKKIATHYGIEKEFLLPILRLDNITPESYLQRIKSDKYLFFCERAEADLRGTGALRYIRDMAGRPSARKKQVRYQKTIKETLHEQSGSCWYAPKAIPHKAHIWMRKAFDATYAPFLFPGGAVLDQRCNFLTPCEGVSWQALATLLCSSIFALSVEAAGSASMGAGALEMPTRRLREVMVIDIRRLTAAQVRKLCLLGKRLWKETPINWKDSTQNPGPALRKLDQFLLRIIGADVTLDDLYVAIKQAVSNRIRLSESKVKQSKAMHEADVQTVSRGIMESFRPMIEMGRFPEAFFDEEDSDVIDLPEAELSLTITPFFGEAEVVIENGIGEEILKCNLSRAVAEVFARALLMGRRRFLLPRREEAAVVILDKFWDWLPPLLSKLNAECATSSLGTKYEGEIRRAAYEQLVISEEITNEHITGRFILPAKAHIVT